MQSMVALHDRERFEVFYYALAADDGSTYYRRFATDAEHFVDLTALSNRDAALRIRSDEIDILVDLMGYTRNARTEIFALQPAPVQVAYLGFAGTLGADFIPYIIADPIVLPESELPHFSEQPVYLPECYQVNDRWQPIAETGARRADYGFPEAAFVFCCFNANYKIEPVIFDVWMHILQRVPGSVLWLFEGSEHVPDNLRREAQARGVAPERLVFAPRVPKDRHLERHRLADLCLDTLIYGAHTTASDALWAGVPVLTCCGEAFASRVGASLLTAVGLPEMIVNSLTEYEELAVELATRPQRLTEIRQKLSANRLTYPLFDTERFVRHLEKAFEMMWAVHAAGEAPRPIYVPKLPSGSSSVAIVWRLRSGRLRIVDIYDFPILHFRPCCPRNRQPVSLRGRAVPVQGREDASAVAASGGSALAREYLLGCQPGFSWALHPLISVSRKTALSR